MISRVVPVVAAAAFVAIAAPRALAIPQFQAEFVKKYVNEHEDKEFPALAKKAKCNICHQGKKSKKNFNQYGAELHKLLDRKKDKENKEKINKALETVGKMHSDPTERGKEAEGKDKKSPTFAALIAAGKLPGGPLEKVLEEPKKDESKEGESEKKDAEGA